MSLGREIRPPSNCPCCALLQAEHPQQRVGGVPGGWAGRASHAGLQPQFPFPPLLQFPSGHCDCASQGAASCSPSLWAWPYAPGFAPGTPSFSHDAHESISLRPQRFHGEPEAAEGMQVAEPELEPTASALSDCSHRQDHSGLQTANGAPSALSSAQWVPTVVFTSFPSCRANMPSSLSVMQGGRLASSARQCSWGQACRQGPSQVCPVPSSSEPRAPPPRVPPRTAPRNSARKSLMN